MTDGNTHAIAQHLDDQEDWDELQEVTVELEQAEARIEELEAKHTELVSAIKDLLHDVRYSILDDELSSGEGYELWEEVKKFRRVIHAAGLADMKGQDDAI